MMHIRYKINVFAILTPIMAIFDHLFGSATGRYLWKFQNHMTLSYGFKKNDTKLKFVKDIETQS